MPCSFSERMVLKAPPALKGKASCVERMATCRDHLLVSDSQQLLGPLKNHFRVKLHFFDLNHYSTLFESILNNLWSTSLRLYLFPVTAAEGLAVTLQLKPWATAPCQLWVSVESEYHGPKADSVVWRWGHTHSDCLKFNPKWRVHQILNPYCLKLWSWCQGIFWYSLETSWGSFWDALRRRKDILVYGSSLAFAGTLILWHFSAN